MLNPEIKELHKIKIELIEKYFQLSPEISFNYWDLMFERLGLKGILSDKKYRFPVIELMGKKRNWLESYVPKNVNEHILKIRQIYFCNLFINSDTFIPPKIDSEYENVLNQEYELLNKIDSSPLENINARIRQFYIIQELKARSMAKKTITKAESDKIINEKSSDYRIIIGLLKEKQNLLEQVDRLGHSWLSTKKTTIVTEIDEILFRIKLIDIKIESYKVKHDIGSKEEFVQMYNERKNIF